MNNKGADQTARMRRLICAFVVRIWHKQVFPWHKEKEKTNDIYEPAHDKTNKNDMCAQRRLRSAWASAHSDQSLPCPHEETLGPLLPTEHTAKTLIRLGIYRLIWVFAGRTCHFVGLSCGGSIINVTKSRKKKGNQFSLPLTR